jgi:hypothetical protein
MKKQSVPAVLILLLASFTVAFSQNNDTLYRTVAHDEAINLNLLWYSINYGSIFWEKSVDGNQWTEIPGEIQKNYRFSADTDLYYRAKVLSGTCDPFYSRISGLHVLNIIADSVKKVTQHHAEIFCTAGVDTTSYPEKGIFYDIKTVPDQNSYKVIDSSNQKAFTVILDSLQEGLTYYARVYVKNTEGVYYLGNTLAFSTQKITATNRVNVSTDSARLFYTVSSTPEPIEHGLFFSVTPGPDTLSLKIAGVYENNQYSATAGGLSPGTVYYALPFMRVDGNFYFGEEKKIRTFSDYSSFVVDTLPSAVTHAIVWDPPSAAKKISPDDYFADYGRVKRIGNTDTLVLVYHGGPNDGDWVNICMRLSYDNGNTWTPQKILMDIEDHISEYWRFCNPEVLVLKNGWVFLAYEANAKPDENTSSVQILISKDTCKTWEGPVIYTTGRSWEPAMVELPNGEIELFYSSEAKWWPGETLYQEIQTIYSTDTGDSWSQYRTVAYYPYKRDGMPVPLLLQGNKGVVFAIESVNSALSPFIIKRDLAKPWILTTSNFFISPNRWVVSNFSGFGGAPYLLQLPTGEILLSAHIGKGGDWHQNNYMQVMVGNKDAKNFGQLTTPWGILPVNESAVNNSLFLKDQETVVAVSCRMFTDGSGGVYWLEGKIVSLK